MQDQQDQLDRIEAKLDGLMQLLKHSSEAKQLERKRWRDRKAKTRAARRREAVAGRLSLPSKIFRPDRRLAKLGLLQRWADKGVEFGLATPQGQAQEFLTWLCFQWNACTYVKKPITFSAGYFKYWLGTGGLRMDTTPFELLGFRRQLRPALRNDAEHVDFRDRKWWDWGFSLLYKVYHLMRAAPDFARLPERFLMRVQLLMGGYAMLEVHSGTYWDPSDERVLVNRCLKRIGPDLQLMWRACIIGLRQKAAKATKAAPVEAPPASRPPPAD